MTVILTSVDFPLTDDFEAIINFVILWQEQDSLGNKLKLIFSQHNEHRLFFLRFITLIQLNTFGILNFKHLLMVGNIFLILIPVIFIMQTDKKIRNYISIPASFLLLNFSSWENQSWAMASLSNFPVITFSMLSLALLDRSEDRIGLVFSILFAILASLSQGNGLFAFFAGIPIICRSKKRLIVWIISAISTFVIYFFLLDYSRPGHTTGSLFSINPFFMKNILSYILHLFASPFLSKLNLIFGSIILTFISLVIVKWKTLPRFDLALMIFVLTTILSLALGRSEFGSGQALSSRYSVYPLLIYLIIIKTYLYSVKTIDKKYFIISALSIIYFYNVNAINILLLNERRDLLNNAKACNVCDEYSVAPNSTRARYVLQKAKPFFDPYILRN